MSSFTAQRRRFTKLAAVPLIIASLAACAPAFNAKVSRFATQLPAPQGQTFAVIADDPRLAGGLEFSQYARAVEDQMARLGYTRWFAQGGDWGSIVTSAIAAQNVLFAVVRLPGRVRRRLWRVPRRLSRWIRRISWRLWQLYRHRLW